MRLVFKANAAAEVPTADFILDRLIEEPPTHVCLVDGSRLFRSIASVART
jgi:hypothetical protein